jgi:hypothetical protein
MHGTNGFVTCDEQMLNVYRAISVVIGPSTGRSLHQVLLNTVMRYVLSNLTLTQSDQVLELHNHSLQRPKLARSSIGSAKT